MSKRPLLPPAFALGVLAASLLPALPCRALDVISYKQCDGRWGGNRLGTCDETICSAGCAITSLSMVFNYYGGAMDPGQLNDCLTSSGGYAGGCNVYWSNSCMPDGTTYTGTCCCDSELDAGRPVVTQVTSGATTMHFVVITGSAGGGDYFINDPAWDYNTISAGGYNVVGYRNYSGNHSDPCDLTASGRVTVIDEQHPCFRKGGSAWWDGASGYSGHMYFTYATDDAGPDCWGRWVTKFSSDASYKVYVHIPPENAESRQAKYRVVHAGGEDFATIDQTTGSGWRALRADALAFSAAGDQYIQLDDNTGEPYSEAGKRKIAYDALMLLAAECECVPDETSEESCPDGSKAGKHCDAECRWIVDSTCPPPPADEDGAEPPPEPADEASAEGAETPVESAEGADASSDHGAPDSPADARDSSPDGGPRIDTGLGGGCACSL